VVVSVTVVVVVVVEVGAGAAGFGRSWFAAFGIAAAAEVCLACVGSFSATKAVAGFGVVCGFCGASCAFGAASCACCVVVAAVASAVGSVVPLRLAISSDSSPSEIPLKSLRGDIVTPSSDNIHDLRLVATRLSIPCDARTISRVIVCSSMPRLFATLALRREYTEDWPTPPAAAACASWNCISENRMFARVDLFCG